MFFVNTIFKVGPSSSKHTRFWWCHMLTIWQLVATFLWSPTLTPCYWLGANHHCPKVDAQKRPDYSKIRKSSQRAGSLQIQTPPFFSYESIYCFFRKTLLVMPLRMEEKRNKNTRKAKQSCSTVKIP